MDQVWATRYIQMATLVGSWSDDADRNVGCVIVGPDHSVRAIGYNGLPLGVDRSIVSRRQRQGGEKYKWIEHAERNAIYVAAKNGVPLAGCTIYMTWFPCEECARAIIQAGIVELVTSSASTDDPSWGERLGVAAQMLREAGVAVVQQGPA
jgi:dCMP deaminase